ncbi:hypothetical protein ACFLZR_01045 [Candidatus Neomarinimicrobiota bacterium]
MTISRATKPLIVVWVALTLLTGQDDIPERFQAHPLEGTTATTNTLYLGEERIWIHIHEASEPGLTYVRIHDDENTAREAAQIFIRDHGGRLVEFRHGRGREVVIRRNGIQERFDPNRMFSDLGLERTLFRYGNSTPENIALVQQFREQVSDLIGIEAGKTIISVHNNTEGNLTIEDYAEGEMYGLGTEELYISPTEDPDDFFITNERILFDALKSQGFNVVLTVDQHPRDPGSLHRYVNRLGGVAVTVEAEHGHLEKQIHMLEVVNEIIKDLSSEQAR